MSETGKIRKIIKAWEQYLYLENLSNASVEVGFDKTRKIWDEKIQLVGNQILIPQPHFQHFKKIYSTLEEKKQLEDFKIAVSFPQIYRVIAGKRNFLPLFTVDISSIWSGKYRSRGWDLTEGFLFQPVIPNLIEFYLKDEEKAENLVIHEGLRTFLSETFKFNFSTLQDFLDLLKPPQQNLSYKPIPYLLRFDYVSYTHNLKKDLRYLNQQEFWDWATPGHPAYEYFFGSPQPPRHDVLFLGAFPGSEPNKSQADALKHFYVSFLTAVIGPPGNGKTSFLLHIIAIQVVKRAYQLVTSGIDESNLTLVTSTNNRAVTNVIEKLAAELENNFFYIEGGRKDLIDRQVIPQLQKAINWLEIETFNEKIWRQSSLEIEKIATQLQSQPLLDIEKARQRERDLQEKERLNREILTLQEHLLKLEQQPITPPSSNYEQYPILAYEQILTSLERAVKSFPTVDVELLLQNSQSWWERLWYSFKKLWLNITQKSPHHILKRLHKEIHAPLTATLATPFPFQLPLTPESCRASYSQVTNQLTSAKKWRLDAQKTEQSYTGQINSIKTQINQLKREKGLIEQRLASYKTEDFYTRFPVEYHQQQQQLFLLSWQYLQQEALRRKDEVIRSIEIYIDVINSEKNHDAWCRFTANYSSILRDVSLLFPVFASTLHSVRNLFPYLKKGCIDVSVIDEAGMIPSHQPLPVLVRSRRAVIVGDPLQLEPIVPFSQSTIEQYHEQAFTEQGLTDADYFRYSPTAIYTATAYHRAAGASDRLGDIGNGIMLNEHYRCVAPIISFCELLSGYKLVIKTPYKESRLGTNLIAYPVEGTIIDHVNLEEVNVLLRLIEHLKQAGYKREEIGVISPYRAQVDALINRQEEEKEDINSPFIGTVHKFQGGQKPVIIFSSRQCQDRDSLLFINRRPNLLNTAVSRAEELFILVGNLERLLQEEGYIKKLVAHIQQFGEIRPLP
ncbi:superfamily I DNA/RNA helicase (plasmid) [Gloeothece citriformis PCC 7424]|uniref:Superfamily I DNA/RNA helicase n=1 Tax=Gloeothece citriformis (strain PCC 7424) TaxID=65393 RepID=B7KMV1_GLOC7|nr:AAA domain-containing protein [Gloeothece citriformis]ACK74123.1 superfamily I DNA/RNA helicase [Gloeothece citriformis PCC 7424]